MGTRVKTNKRITMKARVKATGEVLKVIDVDSERVLVKYGSDAKSLRVHEVDLIPDPTFLTMK